MRIYIDGKEFEARENETLLEACRRSGADVPSMCFVPGAAHKPSCMVCMVRNETTGQMMPSCSTYPAEGMRIDTLGDEVAETRRLAMELLLSDHRADCEAPCTIACPAGLDIGEMLRSYDGGNLSRARSILLSAFPGPESPCEGCKAPCEKTCRRGTVDSPVPIREIIRRLSSLEDIPAKGDGSLRSHIDRSRFSSRLGIFSAAEKEMLKKATDTQSGCLHCACLSREDCRLREIATSLSVRTPRFRVQSLQPFKAKSRITGRLVFEPSKCIRCGLCVYNTEDGFTFKGRGFGMQVILPPESYGNIDESVASLCPTGALALENE